MMCLPHVRYLKVFSHLKCEILRKHYPWFYSIMQECRSYWQTRVHIITDWDKDFPGWNIFYVEYLPLSVGWNFEIIIFNVFIIWQRIHVCGITSYTSEKVAPKALNNLFLVLFTHFFNKLLQYWLNAVPIIMTKELSKWPDSPIFYISSLILAYLTTLFILTFCLDVDSYSQLLFKMIICVLLSLIF